MGAVPDAHLGFCCGRACAADGAVLLRRQIWVAAAAASGGDEQDTAAGLPLLGRDRAAAVYGSAVPVGACQERECGAQGRDYHGNRSALHRLQAADAEHWRVLV